MTIRVLQPEDAALFHTLRLRGLAECPTAFSASHEEEVDTPISGIAANLAPKPDGAVLGYFQDGMLAAVVGIQRERQRKLAHKALIWGMYVAPEYRLNGLGRLLISRALEYAGTELGVRIVNLGVNTRNTAAIALYERMGFRVYGTELGYMTVDGMPCDEHFMGRTLLAG